MKEKVRLTAYSHGAGCGCKISPALLKEIIGEQTHDQTFDRLIVGNEESDDAAVFDLDGENAIVSTTDFFMPIVDDPRDFGAIAATNAISDIYAMGATPLMAIAILAWPVDKLDTEIAATVLEGGREACARAGIPLAGGHSIDALEPIFGLAVTGKVPLKGLKRNRGAQPGDLLYLTKPIGVGMVTTAQKRGVAKQGDLLVARDSMLKMNDVGIRLAEIAEVHSVTDVTGFGLGGHLLEMCRASGVGAELIHDAIPRFGFVEHYMSLGCHPGGATRNWASYGKYVRLQHDNQRHLLTDPQTSGGLLVSVDSTYSAELEALLVQLDCPSQSFGRITAGEGIQLI